MNLQNSNPFSKIRAEQMGDSAWKYFVEPFKDFISAKPLIFEGSRGTGKTMFFKCNSWREKLAEEKSNGGTLRRFLETNKHIGFYYKADGRFVKSLDKKNVDDFTWVGIFNTYFNSVILKEILAFIDVLVEEALIERDFLSEVFSHICLIIEQEEACASSELKSRIELTLLSIEKFSNNTEKPKPVGLNAGTIIEKILRALKRSDHLRSNTFHIFVDEFEVFNESQQIELNTLLKQSDSDIVYDFGVITEGMITYQTGSGQELRPKDDFAPFNPDRFGYNDSDGYNKLLSEICRKRLKEEMDKVSRTYDPKYIDIGFYLKSYGRRYEEEQFKKAKELPKLYERLRDELKRHARIYQYTPEEQAEFYDKLTNCEVIEMRIHLALLMRRKKVVPAKRLVEHLEQNSPEYTDWVHNIENGAIYLLCHELKVEKKYHGFKVYSALSSGVIRSFLELTEYAFDYAFNNTSDLFFKKPRQLTIDEQTKAVYFVSNFKIKEIDSYEPSGLQLKNFTIALGKIFNALQSNSNSTLGEVEHNHFETKKSDLRRDNRDAAQLLKHAVRHKILEEEDATKTKSDGTIEFTDYHLNHIYCPAFRISHLRKRKIPIPHLDLAKLFCGSHKELEEVVRKLSGHTEDIQPNLFSENQ